MDEEHEQMPFDRCIRNERKLDNLDIKLDGQNEKLLKIDITVSSLKERVNKIITNELAHTPTYKETFTKKPKDIALWLTPSIIVAIVSNLDKISDFIEWIRLIILGG